MQTQTEIGQVIEEARKKAGYSRDEFVQTAVMKGKMTSEGLRKIEKGERIPRFHNIRRLGRALGLDEKSVRELERKALEKNVERVAKNVPASSVTFQIKGRAMQTVKSPTTKKAEMFVRGAVDDLVRLVDKYGVMPEDLVHFRQHARSVLHKKLET